MTVLEGRSHDLGGGLVVRRLLPQLARRSVGPFVFFDAMGPTTLAAHSNTDVRPHPHIGLATVTTLFSGALVHRDSLGVEQLIRAGDINWMNAGSGIVHSERAVDVDRHRDRPVHGLQLWCALPADREESAPTFAHHGKRDLPIVDDGGVVRTVFAGSAWGVTSPVQTASPLLYASIALPKGSRVAVPDVGERAIYVVGGSVVVGGVRVKREEMFMLSNEADALVADEEDAVVVVLGGAPLGHRFLDWNFCSSRRELLTAARARWLDRGFPAIPGDDVEFIPLPAG